MTRPMRANEFATPKDSYHATPGHDQTPGCDVIPPCEPMPALPATACDMDVQVAYDQPTGREGVEYVCDCGWRLFEGEDDDIRKAFRAAVAHLLRVAS